MWQIEADFEDIEYYSEDSMNSDEERNEFVVRKRNDEAYLHREQKSDSEEAPMDDLEQEVLSDPENSKNVLRKAQGRKHRSEIEQADLHDDEQDGETIFIDNLPNSKKEISEMLEQVRSYIKDFEIRYF